MRIYPSGYKKGFAFSVPFRLTRTFGVAWQFSLLYQRSAGTDILPNSRCALYNLLTIGAFVPHLSRKARLLSVQTVT
jgi:hypothetical protein